MGCGSVIPVASQYDWQIDKKIGEGAFGQVYEARCRNTRRAAAVKVVSPQKEVARLACTTEMKIWKSIGNHRNIVSLIDSYQREGLYFMVMEKCSCSLRSSLASKPDIRESSMVSLFHEMLSALAYLHSLRIVHRDVKPDNFLLALCSTPFRADAVKLCDFGCAARQPESGWISGGVVGTPAYMSPEMVEGFRHNAKTDIWSFGVICYILVYRSFPYGKGELGSRGMKLAIATGANEPSFSSKIARSATSETTEFISTLLDRTLQNRTSAEEAILSLGALGKHLFLPSSDDKLKAKIGVSVMSDQHSAFESTCDDELDGSTSNTSTPHASQQNTFI
jgi:serine/threonine protein kinase